MQLLDQLKLQRVTDTVTLAKKFGFSVELFCSSHPLLNSYRDMGTLRAGLISKQRKIGVNRTICISEDCELSTKRFFVVYLLANYELYSKPREDYACVHLDEDCFDPRAYRYAVDLLVPDEIYSYRSITPELLLSLAKEYQVSSRLILHKLNNREKVKKFEVIK